MAVHSLTAVLSTSPVSGSTLWQRRRFGHRARIALQPATSCSAAARCSLARSFNLNSNRGFTLSTIKAARSIPTVSSPAPTAESFPLEHRAFFTKAGLLGTLRLTNANTYAGNTTISGGTLAAVNTTGSATGSGKVTVNSGGILGGTGTVTGAVTLASNATAGAGGHVAPGDSTVNNGVGTLKLNSIAFNTGSAADIEFSGDTFGQYDVLNVTGTNGLTISGGGVNLFTAGTTSGQYGTVGTHTYDLIAYNGTLGGTATNLSVLNPEPNFTYQFGTANVSGQNYVTLTVVGTNPLIVSNWQSTGTPDANWNTPTNWSAGVPHSAGDTANFPSTAGLAMTVSLNVPETVGTLSFNNSASYTIQGSSVLTMDSGIVGTAATISDVAGSHFVNVPMTLNSNTTVNVTNSTDTLTLGNNINGNGALTIGTGVGGTGLGTVILAGTNSYAGNTTINSGTLQLNGTGTLGGTNVTNNGTLVFNQSIPYAVNGTINGTGKVTQSGSNVLTLNGANGYQGGTSITGGTLKMGSATALGTGGVTITTPGILDVNATGPSIPGISGSGTVDNTNASSTTIILNPASGTSTFTGAIQNTGGAVTIDKQGAGTQVLNGSDTYTGGTTIDAGTLSINSDSSLGNTGGTLTINTGTLEVNTGFSTTRNMILAGAPSTIQVDSVGSPKFHVLTLPTSHRVCPARL